MAKMKNQRLYSDDPEVLKTWAEEFESIGRQVRLDLKGGMLTVFALPQKRVKKKEDRKKPARRS